MYNYIFFKGSWCMLSPWKQNCPPCRSNERKGEDYSMWAE